MCTSSPESGERSRINPSRLLLHTRVKLEQTPSDGEPFPLKTKARAIDMSLFNEKLPTIPGKSDEKGAFGCKNAAGGFGDLSTFALVLFISLLL